MIGKGRNIMAKLTLFFQFDEKLDSKTEPRVLIAVYIAVKDNHNSPFS